MATLPQAATEKPLARKVRIDTRAVDGVRGFAVFHIVVGHLLLFSEVQELWVEPSDEEQVQQLPHFDFADTVCPEGWLRVADTCYASAPCGREHLTWSQAEAVCAQIVPGGHLMSASTAQMAAVTHAFYPWISDSDWSELLWTGLNERDEKGKWQWTTGRDNPSFTWMEGEPNDWGGQDESCAAGFAGGLLLDASCDSYFRYLCSVEAKMEHCPAPCAQETPGWNGDTWRCREDREGDSGDCEDGGFGTVGLMGGGSMGLFYIISGFVMAVGYCQVELQLCGGCCGGDPDMPKLNACQFWARRLVRLAPTYFLTNAIGVALKAAFSTEEFQAFTASQYVQSVLGLTSWSFVAPVGNGLTWTISTMLFFYLCFPLLGPAVQRVPLAGLRALAWTMYVVQGVLMMLGFAFNTPGYWIRMWPPVRLPIFVMGICAGLSRVRGEQHRAAQADSCQTPVSRRDVPLEVGSKWGIEACLPDWVWVLLWTGLTLYGTTITFLCSVNLRFRFTLEVVFPMIFYEFILAITSPTAEGACLVRFFRSKPMRFLGDISMCAYMIHMLLGEVLGYATGTQTGRWPWWTLLAVLPNAILLGWMLTEFFEKPISRCLRPDRRAAKSPAVSDENHEKESCTPVAEEAPPLPPPPQAPVSEEAEPARTASFASAPSQPASSLVRRALQPECSVDFPQITEICERLEIQPSEIRTTVAVLAKALRDRRQPLQVKLKALTIAHEMLYNQQVVEVFAEAEGLREALEALRQVRGNELGAAMDENVRMLATEIVGRCFEGKSSSNGWSSFAKAAAKVGCSFPG
ncbi:unnamed protein product [Symbiodinium sp. CCMP2592]|nr:unnamed protein product [Symbiodinium sp. CCMP2592]